MPRRNCRKKKPTKMEFTEGVPSAITCKHSCVRHYCGSEIKSGEVRDVTPEPLGPA